MSLIKKHIIQRVFDTVYARTKLATAEEIASQIRLPHNQTSPFVDYTINLPVRVEKENDREVLSYHLHDLQIPTDNVILSSTYGDLSNLRVSVDTREFIKDVLESDPIKLNFKPEKRKVIVEFSSPNVAKPFHAGHLRSTIIGNFISNIKAKMGKDVRRINYLGDWGTQFGLLKLGVEKMGVTEEQLEKSPTSTLYDAYVWANKEAAKDPVWQQRAREEFGRLESGDPQARATWAKFVALSRAELSSTYSRLGVRFDEYQWESDYGRKEVDVVLSRLSDQGLLETDDKGRECCRTLGQTVPMLRSDGATLYLSRDVAAALDRQRIHGFNDMIYVVENGQSQHFHFLFAICQDLGLNEAWNMKHVKFGRIHGMSSRRGQVVFLADILDQARDLVFEKLKTTKTTKLEPTLELADALASAAVIVNDLKQRRTRDYEFSWEKALQIQGDTAIRLQYTHCRLYSLLTKSTQSPAVVPDPDVLFEPEAVALAIQIARFEEVVLRSHEELEACILVNYLFQLTHAANLAFKVLTVKGSSQHIAGQRLLLFSQCKKVVAECLTLLGITPLNQM